MKAYIGRIAQSLRTGKKNDTMQTYDLQLTTHGQEQIAIGSGPAMDTKVEKGRFPLRKCILPQMPGRSKSQMKRQQNEGDPKGPLLLPRGTETAASLLLT